MARISKYNLDTEVTKDDFLIGSDGVTKATRNYKINDLTDFFSKEDIILGDKFSYTYDQSSTLANLGTGKISFNNKNITNTPLASTTNIYFNRYNSSGNDVYDYIVAAYQGDGFLRLHLANNSVYFGVFRLHSVNFYENDVINLSVSSVSSNGYVTGGDLISMSVNYSVGDKSYTHTQLTSSTTWNVTHNLNKRPSVTIVDDGSNVVIGDIQYINENELTITFNSGVSGKAYMN